VISTESEGPEGGYTNRVGLGVSDDAGERFEQAFTTILTNRGKKSPDAK
jgi:hypothetical protein